MAIHEWVGPFAVGLTIGIAGVSLWKKMRTSNTDRSSIEKEIENVVKTIDEQSEELLKECPICLDERKLITLHPCEHQTCPSCILQMKKTSIDSGEYLQFSCPLCRKTPDEISFKRRGSRQRLPFVLNKEAKECV